MKLLQEKIKVSLEYYDEEEKNKLSQYATFPLFTDVVGTEILIPAADFLTYYLFYKKTPGKPGYSDFNQISQKLNKSLDELEDFVEFDGSSVHVSDDINQLGSAICERVGEAIGLSVTGHIHGLHRADWNKLPELPGRGGKKTLDYEIASDGETIIHVENKGTFVTDNRKKSSNVSQHKSNIIGKKSSIRRDAEYPYPSNVMYGTIASIDTDTSRSIRCWLLDPEPDLVDEDPKRLRLLNRFDYLLSLFRMISPRSQFTAALTTRYFDLLAIEDYSALDKLPLRKANGEEFNAFSVGENKGPISIQGKTKLVGGRSIGDIVRFGQDKLVYFGLTDKAMNLLVKQDFDSILDYSELSGSFSKSIKCHFTKTKMREIGHIVESYADVQEGDESFECVLTSNLIFSSDGFVYGVIDRG